MLQIVTSATQQTQLAVRTWKFMNLILSSNCSYMLCWFGRHKNFFLSKSSRKLTRPHKNFPVIALKCRYQQHEKELFAKLSTYISSHKKGSIYRIHNYIHNIINGTSSVYDPCTADGSLLVCGDQNTKFLLHLTCINYSKGPVCLESMSL